jgi:hypothetical protein
VRKIVLRIGGLAVNATEVAPVRHRNAKVVDVTPELVFQHHRCEPAAEVWLAIYQDSGKTF